MKTIFNYLCILLLVSLSSNANNEEEKHPYSKEKTITKAYIVNPDATVQITNSYGAIAVQLWEENKISITVKITVNGKKESTVQEKLDATSIDFVSTTKALIGAKTIFPSDKSWGWNWDNSKVSYQVNYTILIPKRGNVILNNNYGEILVPRLNGSATLKCNYGDITAGELLNSSNSISLNYSGNSKITYANKLNFSANYSDLTLSKGESISASGNYNKYQISNVDKVNGSGNYNDYNLRNIENLNYSGNYTDFNCNNVLASNLDVNYGQIVYNLNSTFQNATIAANYSSIKISTPSDLAFDFDVRCTYGSLKTDLDLNYALKSIKNNVSQYKGNRNSSGKSAITVTTNYGSVQLLKSK